MMLTSWSLVNSLRHFLWTSSCSSKLALGFGVYSHCCAFNAFTICDTLHPRVTFVQVSHCFAGKHPPPCRAAAAVSQCESQRARSRHVSEPLAGEAMLLQKLVPSAATTSIPSTTTPLPHHGPATQYKCKLKYKDKNKNWFFPLLLAYLSLHLHPVTPQAALSRGRGSQIQVEGKVPNFVHLSRVIHDAA